MKKLLTIYLVIACLFSFSATAFAAEETEIVNYDLLIIDGEQDTVGNTTAEPSAADAPVDEDTYYEETPAVPDVRLSDGTPGRGSVDVPDKYWATNGYPEYISFAYEAGGEVLDDGTFIAYWEIGIVDADEDAKQEVIDLLSPNCRITFRDCGYSYNQRETAYNEIRAMDDEAVGAALMVLNSEVVMVEIADGFEKEYAKKFIEQYGSFIVVTNDIAAAQDSVTYEGGGLSKGDTNGMWLWTLCAVFVVGAAMLLFMNRTRLIPAMQTANGTIVAKNVAVSKKEVVAFVKDSEVSPSNDVFKAISKTIDGFTD